MPDLVLDAAAVARLNWQPRACPAPLECIASRRGDVLELVFEPPFTRGGQKHGHRIRGPRHRYRLEPLTETTVRAVCIDAEIWGDRAQ